MVCTQVTITGGTVTGKEWVLEFGSQIPSFVQYLIDKIAVLTGKTVYIEGGTKIVVVF
jgi:hypothetical protein